MITHVCPCQPFIPDKGSEKSDTGATRWLAYYPSAQAVTTNCVPVRDFWHEEFVSYRLAK